MLNICVSAGSLRAQFYSRRLAVSMVCLSRCTVKCGIVPIEDVPSSNADLESGAPPAAWSALRAEIGSVDGYLSVTPECNRSLPAVLTNAIDVGSRPVGKKARAGKPGGVISISMGALVGFPANHHLRQSIVFIDVPMMSQPEACIGSVTSLFDEQDDLKDAPQRLRRGLSGGTRRLGSADHAAMTVLARRQAICVDPGAT